MSSDMKVSVIVSTYNNPEWLEKALWGYLFQDYNNFEIVIADDGSKPATFDLIDRFKKETELKIRHVWHEDDGFRKTIILNKATLEATGEYMIFTDGDCVPRRDFVSVHVKYAQPGRFLSGGYCKLSMNLSKAITLVDIEQQNAFDITWLKSHGLNNFSSSVKLGLGDGWSKIVDTVTPTKATWNGCNASTFKDSIIEVNGHDEAMEYGGEDREMGERLLNLGLESLQIRHRAVLVHLDHARGYISEECLKRNKEIRDETVASGKTWTERGIVKGNRNVN